jgi:pyruvate dehydrogenase E2 component (dihydrolipoamide acetyltransferase)
MNPPRSRVEGVMRDSIFTASAPDFLVSRTRRRTSGDGRSPSFPFPTRFVPTARGRVATFDAGEGEALVFVHGLVGDFTHFEHIAPPLTGHRRVGLDLPGCGLSELRPVRYSMRAYAETVLEVMDRLRVPEATLVGHSAGGQVCLEVARRAPQRVSSLVLLSSTGLRAYPAPIRGAARVVLGSGLVRAFLERAAMPLLDRVFCERNYYTEKFIADALNRPTHPALENMCRVFRDIVPELLTPALDGEAESFPIPTLVVWGAEDRLVPPATARAAVARLPRGRLVLLPSCGHMPMIEQPGRVVAEMRLFLQRRG